jgi:hypothetical protein
MTYVSDIVTWIKANVIMSALVALAVVYLVWLRK